MDKLSQIHNYLRELNYEPPWIYKRDSIDMLKLTDVPVTFVKKNTILFRQHDLCQFSYLIKSGRFRIYHEDYLGHENCIYIAGDGSFIGEGSLIDKKPSFYSAIAIVDCEVYAFNYENLLDSCQHFPNFNRVLLENLSKKLRALSSEITFFSKPAISRIAISLLSLANQYGKVEYEELIISLRFTHEELGVLTNLNRVTVSNIFSDLIKQDILKKSNGNIVIMNIPALMEIVNQN